MKYTVVAVAMFLVGCGSAHVAAVKETPPTQDSNVKPGVAGRGTATHPVTLSNGQVDRGAWSCEGAINYTLHTYSRAGSDPNATLPPTLPIVVDAELSQAADPNGQWDYVWDGTFTVSSTVPTWGILSATAPLMWGELQAAARGGEQLTYGLQFSAQDPNSLPPVTDYGVLRFAARFDYASASVTVTVTESNMQGTLLDTATIACTPVYDPA